MLDTVQLPIIPINFPVRSILREKCLGLNIFGVIPIIFVPIYFEGSKNKSFRTLYFDRNDRNDRIDIDIIKESNSDCKKRNRNFALR